MTTRFRRPLLVLGTTILVMQAVFMPISMVYAETTMNTEEQEQVELPPMKNYLEEEQTSDPRFFFTRSRMQATVEDVTKITFFSDQEVVEATIVLPNEAMVIKDQLPTGLSLEQTDQRNEWVIKATRAQNSFVLPVVFDEIGSYEVSVEEATAQIEVDEKKETEVVDDSFDEQENANEIDEVLESEELEASEEETPEEEKEESPSPEAEDPKDQPAKEEMTNEDHEPIELAVFDGEVAEVSTMAQFREAVANPEIGIISVQANLSATAANILRVDRPLLIEGNGYTLTFGNNGFYFQLEDVEEDSTLRIENATLTKVGATPLLNSSVTASSKWTVELETIREVNANTMRLAIVPEGTIVFTGGVSNFTRTASTTVFIQAKEVQAINQAQVTISRGNATIFSSPATVSTPKLIVDDGAVITLATAAGTANTIDFRGENSEIMLLGAGELTVNTIGPATAATPTDTLNNTIALTGQSPRLAISGESRLSVQSTLSKRGIHLAGSNPQVLVENSELTVVSATQATLNMAGENPRFSAENSTLQLRSTTGQRLNLVGADPIVKLKSSQLTMNASTGRGILLQGATPQLLLNSSELAVSDTGASQGVILSGTDALVSLRDQSEVNLRGSGTGTTENIQIGNNNARPELSVTDGSKLSITTTSATTAATVTANNAIHLRGADPKATVTGESELVVSISSNARRGMYLNGNNAELTILDSQLDLTTVSGQTLNLTGTSPKMTLNKSKATIVSTTGISMTLSGSDAILEANESELAIQSTNGQRMNLIGSNPVLNLKNSQLDMKATTGRGIYLQGATPQVIMENSQLLMTDTGASQGMILQGTDALLSLSNQSELSITGAGTGALENIQIGNNNAHPELSVTGESKLSVTTTSGTGTATDTTNNAIHLRGATPKLNIQNATLEVNIVSGEKRGLFVNGLSADILFVDSSIISSSATNAYAVQSMESNTGSALIKNTKVTIPSGNFAVMTGETLEINNSEINSARLFHHALNVVIKNNSYVKLHHDGSKSNLTEQGLASEGVMGGHRNGQTVNISTGAILDIKRTDGIDRNGFRMGLGNSTVSVERGGKLYINNLGNGIPNNSQNRAPNAGVSFRNGNNNKFTVKDPGSEVSIIAENGAAITNSWNETKHSMDLEVSNGGYFSAVSNTATTASGTFNVSTLTVNFDNPLFLDFRNLQSNGGVVFSTNSASTLTASKSDLALWQRLSDLDSDPSFNFRNLDYSFSGSNLSTLVSTSSPEELNTSVIGNSGLSQFSRLSSNNGRWAIADELRVPTNADKKIHGRVSLPVGLDDSRPAWDDEAIVTVEVESPSGETTKEYTAKTVGDTNELPGISIYGEEPRGGLFEIDLDEPLEAGSKVRISKVELTSGELTDGFEHQILTDTVEVFPIIPPTPAQFSSSIIAQDSTTIQGMTDNLDAEVTATHNSEPLNTEAVMVDADGRFTLDLSEVSLEVDDEIQVFLRDAEGSAVAAGVINPPETNNTRGNINPATELTFHDVTFEPATTLIVGDLGPVSPVDPLDPEIEVDTENKPEIPEDQGQLSIDFVSQFNFGTQSISATNKTYYAQPQRLLNDEGTVNDTEKRPNYVQVSDRRSENDRNGWQLAVTQNTQFTTENDHTLLGAQLQLMNQQLVTAQGGTEPSLQATNPLALVPGQKRTLIRAEGTEGTGTWIYRFGNAENAQESVALHVPKGANPHAESYRTTLIWELSAVPEN
ncbi:WxL domain-containing protein [Enterococcus casseliflavus]|uniref:WxL domain-containing protein n=1 Tax=Enterococcus casseliflavus TaxID=37734 RepID=UPI003EE0CFDA